MQTVYTNVSPLTNAYVHFHQLHLLKRPQTRVILCVWDLFYYEDKRFLPPPPKTRKEQFSENVQNLENTLQHLKIDYKIIYLSEAYKRFFAHPELSKLFQEILSTITFEELKQKPESGHSLFKAATLSRMNYLVVDFLIAAHFHELFPEIAQTMPQTYTTYTEFKPFHDHILKTFHHHHKTTSPQVEFMSEMPIIMDAQGRIPGIDMTQGLVREITEAFFEEQGCTDQFIEEFKPIFATKNIHFVGGASEFIDAFYEYLSKLREIAHKGVVADAPSSLFITSPMMFQTRVKPLNDLKLKILQLCNGKRTSYEIAKLLNLKPVTVSVYFGRLKDMDLISESRRPQLLVRNIVIDINALTVKT